MATREAASSNRQLEKKEGRHSRRRRRLAAEEELALQVTESGTTCGSIRTERVKMGEKSTHNLNSIVFRWDMCFPFPGLLRHVIKHILFDRLPANRRAHGDGLHGQGISY